MPRLLQSVSRKAPPDKKKAKSGFCANVAPKKTPRLGHDFKCDQ